MSKMKRGPKTLEEKINDLDSAFVEDVLGESIDKLRDRLVGLAKNMSQIEQAQKEDADLIIARERVSVLNETYSEPLKAAKLKTKYLCKLLRDKGDAK